jgi:hypothetical protein
MMKTHVSARMRNQLWNVKHDTQYTRVTVACAIGRPGGTAVHCLQKTVALRSAHDTNVYK